ncbi:hypothetical protein HYQ44_013852, partial [Verticillium longisporum]
MVDIVPHQPHARISWPALLALKADNILKVGVGLFREETLDQVTRIFRSETQEHPDLVDITGVKTNRVTGFRLLVTELQEVIGALRGARNLAGSLGAKEQQVQDETVVLENEGRELQATDHT